MKNYTDCKNKNIMEEFIEVRRITKQGGKANTLNVTILLPMGRIRFNTKALKLLNLDFENKALMFFLGKDKIKIQIEDKQPDNYHINKNGMFTCKSLANQITEQLGLNDEGIQYLNLEKINNNFILKKVVV